MKLDTSKYWKYREKKTEYTPVKIPKIGDKVYIFGYLPYKPYSKVIFKVHVGYLGSDSFIIKNFNGLDENVVEWDYAYYNVDWFTDSKKAKKALLTNYRMARGGRWKIVSSHDGCVLQAEKY